MKDPSGVLIYGAHCQRVGAMHALAAQAKAKGKKKEAARYWKAYYDANREKEACLKTLLRSLGFSTPKGRNPSSI